MSVSQRDKKTSSMSTLTSAVDNSLLTADYAAAAAAAQQTALHTVLISYFLNKYVKHPYSLTKLYAARMSIRVCCLRPTSAANPPVAAAVDRRDRRPDGRTPDRYIDTCTAYIASISFLIKRVLLQF